MSAWIIAVLAATANLAKSVQFDHEILQKSDFGSLDQGLSNEYFDNIQEFDMQFFLVAHRHSWDVDGVDPNNAFSQRSFDGLQQSTNEHPSIDRNNHLHQSPASMEQIMSADEIELSLGSSLVKEAESRFSDTSTSVIDESAVDVAHIQSTLIDDATVPFSNTITNSSNFDTPPSTPYSISLVSNSTDNFNTKLNDVSYANLSSQESYITSAFGSRTDPLKQAGGSYIFKTTQTTVLTSTLTKMVTSAQVANLQTDYIPTYRGTSFNGIEPVHTTSALASVAIPVFEADDTDTIMATSSRTGNDMSMHKASEGSPRETASQHTTFAPALSWLTLVESTKAAITAPVPALYAPKDSESAFSLSQPTSMETGTDITVTSSTQVASSAIMEIEAGSWTSGGVAEQFTESDTELDLFTPPLLEVQYSPTLISGIEAPENDVSAPSVTPDAVNGLATGARSEAPADSEATVPLTSSQSLQDTEEVMKTTPSSAVMSPTTYCDETASASAPPLPSSPLLTNNLTEGGVSDPANQSSREVATLTASVDRQSYSNSIPPFSSSFFRATWSRQFESSAWLGPQQSSSAASSSESTSMPLFFNRTHVPDSAAKSTAVSVPVSTWSSEFAFSSESAHPSKALANFTEDFISGLIMSSDSYTVLSPSRPWSSSPKVDAAASWSNTLSNQTLQRITSSDINVASSSSITTPETKTRTTAPSVQGPTAESSMAPFELDTTASLATNDTISKSVLPGLEDLGPVIVLYPATALGIPSELNDTLYIPFTALPAFRVLVPAGAWSVPASNASSHARRFLAVATQPLTVSVFLLPAGLPAPGARCGAAVDLGPHDHSLSAAILVSLPCIIDPADEINAGSEDAGRGAAPFMLNETRRTWIQDAVPHNDMPEVQGGLWAVVDELGTHAAMLLSQTTAAGGESAPQTTMPAIVLAGGTPQTSAVQITGPENRVSLGTGSAFGVGLCGVAAICIAGFAWYRCRVGTGGPNGESNLNCDEDEEEMPSASRRQPRRSIRLSFTLAAASDQAAADAETTDPILVAGLDAIRVEIANADASGLPFAVEEEIPAWQRQICRLSPFSAGDCGRDAVAAAVPTLWTEIQNIQQKSVTSRIEAGPGAFVLTDLVFIHPETFELAGSDEGPSRPYPATPTPTPKEGSGDCFRLQSTQIRRQSRAADMVTPAGLCFCTTE